jgi:hypothetical protein
MHSRIYSILLAAILLAVLNACGTTGSVTESGAGLNLPPSAETDASRKPGGQYDLQRDPSERSLAEVAELSRTMVAYQPEVALEVLRYLESIPSRQLTAMIEGQFEDPEFTEWLELSLLARTTLINGHPVPTGKTFRTCWLTTRPCFRFRRKSQFYCRPKVDWLQPRWQSVMGY